MNRLLNTIIILIELAKRIHLLLRSKIGYTINQDTSDTDFRVCKPRDTAIVSKITYLCLFLYKIIDLALPH